MALSVVAARIGSRRRGPGAAMRGRIAGALALGLALLAQAAGAAQTGMGELVDPTRLRVCADPANLPFSNDKSEGFENKIAEAMAAKLGVPLVYTWYPASVGFVRNTLRAYECDLVMGVPVGDELTQNSNPYYRSAYVLVHRAGEGDRYGDLANVLMRTARIGVVAGTPPADLLMRYELTANTRPYQRTVDTRVDHPGKSMIEDLAAGQLDAALVWGPIGGYWAKRQTVPLAIVPLRSDPRTGLRMDFRISMGIRPEEPEWKRVVNRLIRELQPEITRILLDYGVPLLDEQGNLVPAAPVVPGKRAEVAPPPAAAAAAPEPSRTAAAPAVAEPLGYRTEQYRAPVPATLEGATVLDTGSLKRLIQAERPVLIDVLPKERRPENRDPAKIWIEPKRQNIPGSVWLPNVGYGELPADLRDYFAHHLEQLTGGDKAKPVVFYCDKDCWMSWNAAKRAREELGYTRVHWYPEGVQGWQAAGHDLAPAQALPGAGATAAAGR